MSILQPNEIHSFRSVTTYSWNKPDLHKVGKDIYERLSH